MDKKLLKAKQELQKYTNIWIVIAICSVLILVVNRFGYLTKSYADSHFANYMNGLYTGLFIVIIIGRQIELMSKRQAFLIAEDLLLVIAIITSFINSYLFAGIIIAIIVFILVSIICKEYYKRTFTGEE